MLFVLRHQFRGCATVQYTPQGRPGSVWPNMLLNCVGTMEGKLQHLQDGPEHLHLNLVFDGTCHSTSFITLYWLSVAAHIKFKSNVNTCLQSNSHQINACLAAFHYSDLCSFSLQWMILGIAISLQHDHNPDSFHLSHKWKKLPNYKPDQLRWALSVFKNPLKTHLSNSFWFTEDLFFWFNIAYCPYYYYYYYYY